MNEDLKEKTFTKNVENSAQEVKNGNSDQSFNPNKCSE